MTEPLGNQVLRHIGKHYRKHRGSWRKCCYGSLADLLDVCKTDPEIIARRLEKGEGDGCISTMIRAYSFVLAGTEGRQHAEDGAIRLLCEFKKAKISSMKSIQVINDNELNSVDDAIAFVEAPLKKLPRPSPSLSEAKKMSEELIEEPCRGAMFRPARFAC